MGRAYAWLQAPALTNVSFATNQGCRVAAGTKWTLQKFKELPMEMRTRQPGTAVARDL